MRKKRVAHPLLSHITDISPSQVRDRLLSFVKQNNFLCTKLIIFECDDSKIALHKYDNAKANKMQCFTDEF